MALVNSVRLSYLANDGYYVDPQAMQGLRAVYSETGDVTVDPGTTNSIYIARKTSATQTFTFPKASTCPGMQVTLICGSAAGEINTAVDAADSVVGLTFAAIGADADTGQISTTAGKGIKNTGATNVVGDNVTLVSDGLLTWFILGNASGIWVTVP